MHSGNVDDLVAFLGKRDGIDKVLKVIRYTSKLVLATTSASDSSSARTKWKALDTSLGTTRKALRVGKFLASVQQLGLLDASNPSNLLPAAAAAGEGVYYFLDQFVWLCKAGVLPPHLEAKLSLASAYAELTGYAASITIKAIKLRKLEQRLLTYNTVLSATVSSCSITSPQMGTGDDDMVLRARRQAADCRAQRRLLLVLLVQDLADALIALQEVVGGKLTVARPSTVALCGLVSAGASMWKNWPRHG